MTKHYVGVDLGGTNMRCAVVDDDNTVLSRHHAATNSHEGAEAVMDRLVAGVGQVVADAGLAASDVAAACIGLPGPINQRTGVVYSATNMPGWDNVPLAEIMTKRTSIVSFLENDANCAGWGEFSAGAGKGASNMAMVTIGTGIGGALILDGRLILGRDGTAGEFGHMCVEYGGRPCGCGGRGCIEAYASAASVARRFRDLLAEGWTSSLSAKGADVTSRDIFQAATAGDPVSLRIVESTGQYLGVLCASLAEILNPERCVISGGMIEAGEELFHAVRESCMKHNRHPAVRTMEIVPAALGGNAGLVGAANCAKERLRQQ